MRVPLWARQADGAGVKRWAVVTHASEPPSSEIAKAAAYMLNPLDALTRFVHDSRLLRCAWTRQDGLVAVVPVIDCGDRTVRDCEVTTSQESPAVPAPLAERSRRSSR